MNPYGPRRLKKLRLLLKKKPKKPLIVTNLTNIRYLTGLQVSSGVLIVDPRRATLFVDSRYSEAARSAGKSFVLRDPAVLGDFLKRTKAFAFESGDVTVARMERWKKSCRRTTFIPTSGLVEGLRRKKDPEEIRLIRRACSITKKVLANIPSMLVPGVTELGLRLQIEKACYDLGADGMAFETIVAFGENTSRPHHHATSRKLKRADIVQIDMGCSLRGYCSDYSRVYFTGPKKSEHMKSYRALIEAKKSAEMLLRSGVTNHALDAEARRVLARYGYDKEFSHALGHGVGLDIHEGITFSKKAPKEKVQKNEVVTLEPGVYFPGKFGMRIEDTYVVS